MILQQNRLRWYGHVLRKDDNDWVKKCMEYEVEGSRPKRTWKEVVQEDWQERKLNKEDAMDRCKWRKVIRDRSTLTRMGVSGWIFLLVLAYPGCSGQTAVKWLLSYAAEGVSGWGGTMASAEHEPITGVWRQSPQRGPWAEPLVRGSRGRSPLKLKAFWSLDVQRSRQI